MTAGLAAVETSGAISCPGSQHPIHVSYKNMLEYQTPHGKVRVANGPVAIAGEPCVVTIPATDCPSNPVPSCGLLCAHSCARGASSAATVGDGR